MSQEMSSSQPYLLRAFYDWILDNQCTPHVVVDTTYPLTDVPQQFVESGRIVLNIHPDAVMGLVINNDDMTFSARFSGVETNVYVPIPAVLLVYAQENGQGMVFDNSDTLPMPPDDSAPGAFQPKKSKPNLKLVK